ncbi:XRE family transcriptional regulator [Methylobacterium nodulans]|uniref:Transcriptional regulator, XRE family n=1 Tax=Methylobacterium nodulans (strain LMG 21967 / CNCM I-2342 / ORS 2060) TaxID=460265 RepID=B8IT78_METNO|nr:helix-turn-helix domain-containing protein [Methylobacterium nodulans]ACL56964.1 transcriptional regulator, XRE family [Methylobacterium nodulans ORS 2060]
MSTIGNNVRNARLRLGMTQEQLAEAANVSQTTIDKIERGLTKRSKYLPWIAIALSVDISELDNSLRYSPTEKEKDVGEVVSRPHLLAFRPGKNEQGTGNDSIPVYIATEAGNGGFLKIDFSNVDYALRPRNLDNSPSAYGLYIAGGTMHPELSPGDMAFFDTRLPVIVGSTVLFQRDDDVVTAFLGRLQGFDATYWTTYCWEDRKSVDLPREEWPRAHRMAARYTRP